MAIPAVSSVSCTETTVDIVWDQTVNSPTGQPGLGFSVKVDGVARSLTNAVKSAATTVRLTVSGVISDRDTVLVSYSSVTGDLVNGTSEDAATFTDHATTNASLHAAFVSATCEVDTPNIVTLAFSLPITSVLGLGTGLTFKKNTVLTAFSTVVAAGDPRKLIVTFAGNFAYDDDVTFSYNPGVGDWTSGYDIVTMTDVAVVNASIIGTPSSVYPLSSIVREQLVATSGWIEGRVGLDLNQIDQVLVERYGPATVDFGGTFGVSVDLPAGVFLAQDLKPLKSGMSVTKRFLVTGRPDLAAIAADEWLETVTARIGTALGAVRTTDAAVVLGDRTVRQV